jgi:membrane protease YdiL (CAAX protease family)
MNQAAADRPFFEISGLRFRMWPSAVAIVAAGLLMEGMLRLGRMPAKWLYQHGPAAWDERIWIYVGLAILFQALLGLIGIAIMHRALPQADSHLRWPPGRSDAGLALALGVGMGLVMLIADYWPQLFTGAALDSAYPVDPIDSTGWLVAMGITGLAEETIFRGLMVGALVVFVGGRVRAGSFDVPIAGVVVALLFGIAHWKAFVVDPLHMAIAQQSYAFAWGLIYVWLMERSRSLLAPIIAHGAGNAVEVGLVMLLSLAMAGP